MESQKPKLGAYLYKTLMTGIEGSERGNIISVIGSGGKTSCIELLAQEALNNFRRVLITTTTKMAHPDIHSYSVADSIILDSEVLPPEGKCLLWGRSDGIKILPGRGETLEQSLSDFDLILIEADGARGKPLKVHTEGEPVIPSFTEKTIHIFGLSAMHTQVKNSIHRYERLDRSPDSLVDPDLFLACMHEPVERKGEPVILLNQADTISEETLHEMERRSFDEKSSVFIGSLHDDTLYYAHDGGALS